MDSAELAKLPTALRTLRRAARASSEEVLYGFAGVVLKACAGKTKVVTQAKADRRSALYTLNKRGLDLTGSSGTQPGDITVNAGWKGPFGRVWVRSPAKRKGTGRPFRLAGQINKTNFNFRPTPYHWKKGTWIDIMEAAADVAYQMRKAIPAGRKAVTLARQSWVQIADSLNIRLEDVRGGGTLSAAGIAKARAALASTGIYHINGLSRKETQQRGLLLTLINRYPRGRKAGFDATLQGTLIGQVRYFQQNLERGVFNSIQKTVRAYPFLKATNN